MSESIWTTAQVAELYDGSCHMSNMFNDGYEHLGYWYDETDGTTVEEAGKRLTRKLVDAVGLGRGDHVLDAGCGVGSPATQIAREYGARITGITISEVEAQEAEKRAARAGLFHQLKFQVHDYHALPYSDNHFDAVIAIESLMHAIDLEKVLSELRRVLKPGGRLGLTETTMVHPGARVPDLFRSRTPMTADAWLGTIESAGFVLQEWTQCGPRVYSMSHRYLDRTDEIRDELVAKFGEEFVETIKNGQRDMFAPGPEHMSYLILCARKPVE